MRSTPLVLIATALLLAGGAATATAESYLRDRGNDFLDIFRLRAGMPNNGEAWGAKVRVTSLAQVGYVHFDGDYIGLSRRGFGWIEERRTEGGVSLAYASRHQNIVRSGNQYLSEQTLWSEVENRRLVLNKPYWDDGRGDVLSIGAEVATPIGALDLAVNPSQALDFVVGWVGIDLFNDDERNLRGYWRYQFDGPTTPPGPDPQAATARKRAQLIAEGSLVPDAYDEAMGTRATGRVGVRATSEEAAELFGIDLENRTPPTPARGAAIPPDEPLSTEGQRMIEERGERVQPRPPARPGDQAPDTP